MSGKEKSARKAAAYLFTGGILSKAITLIGAIATARILEPADYGYNLSIALVASFLGKLSFVGFETYFIQKRDITESEESLLLGNIFTMRIIQNILLFFIHLALATYFYLQDSILGELLFITSLVHIFGIIGKPSEAVLSKEFEFKPIVKSNLVRDITAVSTRIGFALAGFGAYSFAIALVVSNIVRQALLFFSIKKNIKLSIDLSIVKKVFKFGLAVITGGFGNYIKFESSNIILAANYSKTQVGFYDFSKGQADVVNTYFLYPQLGLVLSYLSKNKDNPEKIHQLFSSVGIIIAYFFIPVFSILFLYAEDIIFFVFGSKWVDATTLFRIFILLSAHTAFIYPTQPILTSVGKPEIKAKINIIFSIFSISTLLILSLFNVSIEMYTLLLFILLVISDYIILITSLSKISYSITIFFIHRIETMPFLLIAIALVSLGIEGWVNYLIATLFIFMYYFRRRQILLALKVFLGRNKIIEKLIKYV